MNIIKEKTLELLVGGTLSLVSAIVLKKTDKKVIEYRPKFRILDNNGNTIMSSTDVEDLTSYAKSCEKGFVDDNRIGTIKVDDKDVWPIVMSGYEPEERSLYGKSINIYTYIGGVCLTAAGILGIYSIYKNRKKKEKN